MTKQYSYHLLPTKRAQTIRKKFNAKILKIQAIYIVATALIFLLTFYIRYFMVSISPSAQIDDCVQQEITFDWWDYNFMCSACIDGFELTLDGL